MGGGPGRAFDLRNEVKSRSKITASPPLERTRRPLRGRQFEPHPGNWRLGHRTTAQSQYLAMTMLDQCLLKRVQSLAARCRRRVSNALTPPSASIVNLGHSALTVSSSSLNSFAIYGIHSFGRVAIDWWIGTPDLMSASTPVGGRSSFSIRRGNAPGAIFSMRNIHANESRCSNLIDSQKSKMSISIRLISFASAEVSPRLFALARVR